MCWISRLRFKKNGTALCPADITHLPVGHQPRPGLKDQRPRAKTVRRRIFTTTRLRRQDPPQVYHPPPGCCLLADCLAAGKNQTVRRARPLALRRAITFRPFLVLMRFRNPCSRLRLRFEGCLKVNDIAHSLSRDHSSMKRPHYRGGTGGCQSTLTRQSALQGRTKGEPELNGERFLTARSLLNLELLRHSCPTVTNMPQKQAEDASCRIDLTNCSEKTIVPVCNNLHPGIQLALVDSGAVGRNGMELFLAAFGRSRNRIYAF